MARNQKLTRVIQGRAVQSAQQQNNVFTVVFTDGSAMTVKTGQPVTCAEISNSPVKAVRQQDTTFDLDFADGTTLEIQTAEATSSVMLRDKTHVREYAD
jgi:hypothetical protein